MDLGLHQVSPICSHCSLIFSPQPCDDYFLLEALTRVIQIWEDESIFVQTFTQLLKKYLQPAMEAAKQQAI